MKEKRKPHSRSIDRSRINLNEPREVRYWTEALGIEEDLLRDTVAQFGDRVKDVHKAIEMMQAAQRAGRKPAKRATPYR